MKATLTGRQFKRHFVISAQNVLEHTSSFDITLDVEDVDEYDLIEHVLIDALTPEVFIDINDPAKSYETIMAYFYAVIRQIPKEIQNRPISIRYFISKMHKHRAIRS